MQLDEVQLARDLGHFDDLVTFQQRHVGDVVDVANEHPLEGGPLGDVAPAKKVVKKWPFMFSSNHRELRRSLARKRSTGLSWISLAVRRSSGLTLSLSITEAMYFSLASHGRWSLSPHPLYLSLHEL